MNDLFRHVKEANLTVKKAQIEINKWTLSTCFTCIEFEVLPLLLSIACSQKLTRGLLQSRNVPPELAYSVIKEV